MIKKFIYTLFLFSIVATPTLSMSTGCKCEFSGLDEKNNIEKVSTKEMPCHQKMASSHMSPTHSEDNQTSNNNNNNSDNNSSDSSKCCDDCQCSNNIPAIKISIRLDDHGLDRQNYYLPLDRTKRSNHFNEVYNPPKS